MGATSSDEPEPYSAEIPGVSRERPAPEVFASGCLVVLSSFIAFVATCFPIGFVGLSMPANRVEGASRSTLVFAVAVGAVVALIVGFLLTKLLDKLNHRD